MKYKRYIFPILMGSTMSCIMSQMNTGKIVFPSILLMMLLQSIVASIASLIFPAGLIGAKVTEKLYTGKSYILFFSSFINNSSDIFYYNYVCKRIVKNEGI